MVDLQKDQQLSDKDLQAGVGLVVPEVVRGSGLRPQTLTKGILSFLGKPTTRIENSTSGVRSGSENMNEGKINSPQQRTNCRTQAWQRPAWKRILALYLMPVFLWGTTPRQLLIH